MVPAAIFAPRTTQRKEIFSSKAVDPATIVFKLLGNHLQLAPAAKQRIVAAITELTARVQAMDPSKIKSALKPTDLKLIRNAMKTGEVNPGTYSNFIQIAEQLKQSSPEMAEILATYQQELEAALKSQTKASKIETPSTQAVKLSNRDTAREMLLAQAA